jgi:hypothetical protein
MLPRKRLPLIFALASRLGTSMALPQQKPAIAPTESEALTTYDLHREVTVVGTVLSFTTSSRDRSRGPYVALQAPSGMVDVHLGDAAFLAANHFTIHSGDTIRVLGEVVARGNGRDAQFVARVIQKGHQTLVVRSIRGFPLTYAAPRNQTPSKQPRAIL